MEVDIESPDSLESYLREMGKISPRERVTHRVLAGGVSNKTVLVQLPDGMQWVLKQALEKLRVKIDWHSSPDRIHREAAGMRALSTLVPDSITPFIFEDLDHHILAMRAVPEPHANLKTLLMQGQFHLRWFEQLADLLAAIHGGAWDRRTELASQFAERGFFESLRIEPYYTYSMTHEPAVAGFIGGLIDETRRESLTLTHGDFSPKNVLVRDDRLILLDHEVIHWGDPAFDVGFLMAHVLSKAHHLHANRKGFLGAASRFWEQYCANLRDYPWQADIAGRCARHGVACLLARVVGRSPLEYLTDPEKRVQRQAVVSLAVAGVDTVHDLIVGFGREISRLES